MFPGSLESSDDTSLTDLHFFHAGHVARGAQAPQPRSLAAVAVPLHAACRQAPRERNFVQTHEPTRLCPQLERCMQESERLSTLTFLGISRCLIEPRRDRVGVASPLF